MGKKEYDLKYHRENCRQVKFALNKEIDKDIISFLETKKPIQTYLKALLREEIKKER